MRRAATVLLTAVLTAGGMAALAPPASAADIAAARPHDHGDRTSGRSTATCEIDADLYVPAGVDAAHAGAGAAGRPTASAAPRTTRPTSPRASASRAT